MIEDDTNQRKRVSANKEAVNTSTDWHETSRTNRLISDGGTTNPDDTDGSDPVFPDFSESASLEIEEEEELPSLTPNIRKFLTADRNNECELCGADGADETVSLEVHHRVQKADGGTNHPDNLLLLCRECHQQHHGNKSSEAVIADLTTTADSGDNSTSERVKSGSNKGSLSDNATEAAEDDTNSVGEDTDPLPPQSTPNGADKEIIAHIEDYGAATTGQLAEALDYSKVYIRRECWKLSGEQLIVPQDDNSWESVS